MGYLSKIYTVISFAGPFGDCVEQKRTPAKSRTAQNGGFSLFTGGDYGNITAKSGRHF